MLVALMLVTVFSISVWLTYRIRNLAGSAQLLALPTDRSSHTLPTPVGGGMSIVFAYILGLLFLWRNDALIFSELLVFSASLPVALIGLIDDKGHVDFKVRLLVQAVGALYVLFLLGKLPPILIGSSSLDLSYGTWLLVPLALLWLTNLYNFMDGIDGLAGIETCFVSGSAAFLLSLNGDISLALLCLFVFAGATGFLVFNWSPASIFMGDVGSGFLGYSLGLIALVAHYHGSMSLWSWVLLLAVFVVDATITLSRRVVAGRRWHHAHRTHAYQHAAQQFASHKVVTVTVLAVNVLWLLPLAWLADKHPEYGVYFSVGGIVPLAVLTWIFNAGRETS